MSAARWQLKIARISGVRHSGSALRNAILEIHVDRDVVQSRTFDLADGAVDLGESFVVRAPKRGGRVAIRLVTDHRTKQQQVLGEAAVSEVSSGETTVALMHDKQAVGKLALSVEECTESSTSATKQADRSRDEEACQESAAEEGQCSENAALLGSDADAGIAFGRRRSIPAARSVPLRLYGVACVSLAIMALLWRQWHSSARVPAGWERAVDAGTGKVYYRNKELGRSQWEYPTFSEQKPTMPRRKRRIAHQVYAVSAHDRGAQRKVRQECCPDNWGDSCVPGETLPVCPVGTTCTWKGEDFGPPSCEADEEEKEQQGSEEAVVQLPDEPAVQCPGRWVIGALVRSKGSSEVVFHAYEFKQSAYIRFHETRNARILIDPMCKEVYRTDGNRRSYDAIMSRFEAAAVGKPLRAGKRAIHQAFQDMLKALPPSP